MMVENHYRFHGVGIVVATDDAAIAHAVHLRLATFTVASAEPAALRFEVSAEDPGGGHDTGHGRTIYDHAVADVRYFDHRDEILVEHSGVTMWCRPGSGSTIVHAPENANQRAWTVSRPMFTIALLEMLKRRRFYSLHAAAAETAHGDVILLAGESGSGKSTLALALARSKWPVLGDDTVFLVDDGEDLGVRSFPDEIDVSDTTVAMFPRLRPVLERPPAPATGKRQFRLEEFYDSPTSLGGRPVALVFPTVTSAVRSELVPLDDIEAMVRLAPNVLLTEPTCCQAHLDALGRLVRDVPTLSLATGSDLDEAVALLATLGRT